MSITIGDTFLLNPVRNPVRLEATTDNLVVTPATLGEMRIKLNEASMPGDGQTLTIYPDLAGYPGNGIVWYIKTTPTSDPYDVRAYSTGDTELWANTYFVPALQADYWVSEYFDVTVEDNVLGPELVFTQKAGAPVGNAYALSTTFATRSGTGPSTVAAVAEVTNANFKVLVQLWVEDGYGSGTYTKVLEEEYEPDSDGLAYLYVERVLRAYVGTPTFPDATDASGVQLTSQFVRWYARFAEKYGTPPAVETGLLSTSVLYAYLAGTSEPDRMQWLADGGWIFFATPDAVSRFLTAWPNTSEATAKLVLPEQREHLAYVVPFGVAAGGVACDIYYHDGTSSLANILESITDWDQYELWLAHVGVEAQGLRDLNPYKTISHYNIYLFDQADNRRISERRWFRVRYDHVDNFRQLHYLNSLGGWDTMPLYGPRAQEFAVDRVVSERNGMGATTTVEARDRTTVLNAFTDTYEAGTCMLRPDELDALKELLGSEAIVERVGDEHWPVELLDEKLGGRDEAEQLTGRVVKYRYALTNTAHS